MEPAREAAPDRPDLDDAAPQTVDELETYIHDLKAYIERLREENGYLRTELEHYRREELRTVLSRP
jgi:regulator of replication initiation timing